MAETLAFEVLAKASGTADVKKLGDAIDGVGKSADDLGKKGGGGAFSGFETSAKSAAKSVGDSFTKIGDSTKGIGSKLVSGLGNLAEMGQKAGSSLVSGISSALEGLGPGGAAVGGAVLISIAAAAPLAGGILGGALIAGVAAAGIGVGVMQALKDPEVGNAAADLGQTMSKALEDGTKSFVPATLDAIDRIKDRFVTMQGDITRLFSNLAPSVGPLADKAGAALQSIVKGAADLTQAAGPVLDALGTGLANIGRVIGSNFSDMKDQGAAAAVAIKLLFDGIGTALTIVLNSIDGLLTALGWIAEKGLLGPQVKASYEGWKTALDGAKTSVEQVGTASTQTNAQIALQATQTGLLTGSFMDAANAATGLKGALDQLNGAAISGVEAEIQYQAAIDALSASVTKNGTSLNLNTQAGRDNTTALTNAIKTAQQYASANNLSATEVDALRQRIIDQATAAGMDSDKVKALTADLFAIPGEVNPKINILGYEDAKRQVAEIDASLRGLPKTVQTQIITQHLDVYNAVGAGSANAAENRARAYGGIDLKMAQGGAITSHFTRSPTVLYGERGDEAYIAKDAPKKRSRAILEQVAEKWLGGRVSWGGEQRTAPPPTGAGRGSSGGDGAILAALNRLVRATESGGHVYLDSRLVGAVQGRESSLFERAG